MALEIDAVLPLDMFGQSHDQRSISIIREFEPAEGYWLAFSGGKDSVVLYDLTERSGVKFDAHYNFTGIDPPELVRFIRDNYPDVGFERPKMSFWEGIGYQKGLPGRNKRWCCRELKERGGERRRVLTGVRAAESHSRSRYHIIQQCKRRKSKTLVNPMLSWPTEDIWEYIKRRNLPYCSLYDEGFKRLGCVFCPFNTEIVRAQERWPKLFNALRFHVNKQYQHIERWQKHWDSGDEVLEWWLDRTNTISRHNDEQMVLDQFGDEDE